MLLSARSLRGFVVCTQSMLASSPWHRAWTVCMHMPYFTGRPPPPPVTFKVNQQSLLMCSTREIRDESIQVLRLMQCIAVGLQYESVALTDPPPPIRPGTCGTARLQHWCSLINCKACRLCTSSGSAVRRTGYRWAWQSTRRPHHACSA